MLQSHRISIAFFVLFCVSPITVHAQEDILNDFTPMRLSYTEGDASFWRPGNVDWSSALPNTPLAAGDALYVGEGGILELQLGSRAFIRAGDNSQLSLLDQTPDLIRFKVTFGRLSFDLRSLPLNYTVGVITPSAELTINRPGYYRVDVNGEVRFTNRRGGMAILTPTDGDSMNINPSETVVINENAFPGVDSYSAPSLDDWDQWNYQRTDALIDSPSERYLPRGVSGASDLDRYGSWQEVQDYGPVWIPDYVPDGWVPYSSGSWGWDPYYQWTWIDDAPWGWVPFHYGRWVYLGGYWAWTPGPVINHPLYSPALVAFFINDSNASGGFTGTGIGWVALGWGESASQWWGSPSFVGRRWWGGWGGTKLATDDHENTHIHNSVLFSSRERFGRDRNYDQIEQIDRQNEFKHLRGKLPIKPNPDIFIISSRKDNNFTWGNITGPISAQRHPVDTRPQSNYRNSNPAVRNGDTQRYAPASKQLENHSPKNPTVTQDSTVPGRQLTPPRFEDRHINTYNSSIPIKDQVGISTSRVTDVTLPGQPFERRTSKTEDNRVRQPKNSGTRKEAIRSDAPKKKQQGLTGNPDDRVHQEIERDNQKDNQDRSDRYRDPRRKQ